MLLSIFIGNNHVFSIGLWAKPTLETMGEKVNHVSLCVRKNRQQFTAEGAEDAEHWNEERS